MKYLFLDTNVFMHYEDIEQINWLDIDAGFSEITFVIPPVVMQEIDRLKDSSTGKKKERARKVNSRFKERLITKVPTKYAYSICDNPSDNLFDGKKFNKEVDDDWFILSAIDSGYDRNDIVIVCNDTHPTIKATQKGLKVVEIPDKYLLKEEPSDIEKENIELKKELLKLKNRQSKPSITFEEGKNLLEVYKPSPRDLEKELEIFMVQLKANNPYYVRKIADDPYNSLPIFATSIVSDEQICKFNEEMDEYYQECYEYQKFLIKNEILSARFKKITFELHNKGTAQTGDIKIFIEFPHDIRLYSDLSKDHKNELIPLLPQIGIMNRNFLKSIQFNKYVVPGQGIRIPIIYCWNDNDVRESNKFTLTQKRLNHNLIRTLEIDNSIYIDAENCGNFKIIWNVSDSELIELKQGSLDVVVLNSVTAGDRIQQLESGRIKGKKEHVSDE